ncbi:hypothetical protein OG369_39785 [Streptomyces sp. NBC_01221]|uniref:hypothetical protein n=1 Tax=Streptomyces sp. NBC_01221 TaxID=2903782 RepID=UPI002255DF3E|nr:hypothetical protein [Streptomyces sp. NBC_01221]MCX4791992.1 hypothetical protein [Streptomyces sp. NBC_01221]
MDISELTAAAQAVLRERAPADKPVAAIAVNSTRDDSGWISYDNVASVAYCDDQTQRLDISGTELAVALEKHADDEAELGSVPDVTIPILPPHAQSRSSAR